MKGGRFSPNLFMKGLKYQKKKAKRRNSRTLLSLSLTMYKRELRTITPKPMQIKISTL